MVCIDLSALNTSGNTYAYNIIQHLQLTTNIINIKEWMYHADTMFTTVFVLHLHSTLWPDHWVSELSSRVDSRMNQSVRFVWYIERNQLKRTIRSWPSIDSSVSNLLQAGGARAAVKQFTVKNPPQKQRVTEGKMAATMLRSLSRLGRPSVLLNSNVSTPACVLLQKRYTHYSRLHSVVIKWV